MKNLGDLNNWTKNDLARVVCQALFNSDLPLTASHFQVKRMMKHRKSVLVDRCAQAIEIISKRKIGNIDADTKCIKMALNA